MQLKDKIDTNLGITIILVFAALATVVSFIIVGNELDGYPFSISCGSVTNGIVNEEKESSSDVSYIRTTSIQVLVGDRESFANVDVSNGNLVVNLGNETKDFIISGETVKYIYSDYYQYSDLNVIFVLTESGNVYVNEFYVYDSNIDVFANFVKMNYSNVFELKLVDNENYGVTNEVGMIDNKKTYVYAVMDGSLVKLDNQYSM